MKKKLISALLCVSMAGVLLAGCSSESAQSPEEDSGKAEAEESSEESEAAEAGGDYAGETLTVLYMSGVYADAANDMKEEFEAQTGATVEVIDMPYAELHEKILLDLTSGTGTYDVIDVASQWDGEFAPYLLNLKDFMERDGYDMDVWIENVLANCGEWQGEYYGIPNASTPQTFAYRTDIFPDGLADNWEDYRAQLAEVNDPDNGFYGVTISGISGQLGGVFDYVLWSMGGAWADEDWNITIDSAQTRAALEHLYEVQDYMNPNWLNWGTDESIQDFLAGNAAVCETWPSLGLVQAADDPEQSEVVDKWALSVIPYDETGVTLLSAWDVSIPSDSQHQDLAWEWTKMYTSFEMQNRFYEEDGILSPRKEFWEQDGIKGTYMDTLRDALDTANMWWRIPASTEVDTMLNTVVGSYLTDQADIETTVQDMKDNMESALESSPPAEGIKNYNR